MTTDNFAEAARAEAERRWPRVVRRNKTAKEWLDEGMASGFVLGAQWSAAQEPTDAESIARKNLGDDAVDRLAEHFGVTQEPTDAGPHELDENAPIRNLGYYRSSTRCKCGYEVIWGEHDGDAGLDAAWRVHLMRSAVHVARAARRDEEGKR